MKFLRNLFAKFLQKDVKGYVLNSSWSKPEDVTGWVFGTDWHIEFSKGAPTTKYEVKI